MSSETQPISPTRFAEAIQDLPLSSLHLKVIELRNSIAHLDYSNEQLRPFAEGRERPLETTPTASGTTQIQAQTTATATGTVTGTGVSAGESGPCEPDQDCIDAIRENEQVIARMEDRIRLIRAEVEGRRGQSWDEFRSTEEISAAQAQATTEENSARNEGTATNGNTTASTNVNGASNPWTDGTFQTGVIRGGQVIMDNNPASTTSSATPAQQQQRPSTTRQPGGSLTDDELRRRMEEQMRNLGGSGDDNEEEGGMHL